MLNFHLIPKIPLPLYQKITKPSLPLFSLSLSLILTKSSIKPTVLYNFLVKIIVSHLHCLCEVANIKGNIHFEGFWRRKTMGNEILHFVLGIICLHFFWLFWTDLSLYWCIFRDFLRDSAICVFLGFLQLFCSIGAR